MTKTVIFALAAAGLVLAPSAWADTAFTPDAAATWAARSERMADVSRGETATETELFANMVTACDGLQGEQVSHEYGKAPQWAVTSQLDICSAYLGFSHKFMGAKSPCQVLQRGVDRLAGVKPDSDPANVVAAQADLMKTTTDILNAARDVGGCHR